MGGESYSKGPLSGASNYTAEPQEMPLQTSMPPSVQLSLATSEQQPIRTQYAYVQPTTAPPQLSISTTAMGSSDHGLNVPRYVDNNPRPAKSPRHASHQSVHSAGSLTNNEASSEYRYGSSYVSVNNNSSNIPPSTYNSESSNPQSAPPRDYYPPSTSWTTTAGEPNSTAAYTSNEGRSYSFSDQYKPSSSAAPAQKSEQVPLPPPGVYSGASRGSFDAISHYSWNAN
jgi:hypothetical protein